MLLKVEPFLITEKQGKQAKRLKIFTPKEMLHRLPISLTQVEAGNTSENLLNEIRQYHLCQAKEVTKTHMLR